MLNIYINKLFNKKDIKITKENIIDFKQNKVKIDEK